MNNILNIEGHKTGIINPATGYDLDLRAIYQNTTYDFSKVTGAPQAMILHFSRQDNLPISNGLNIILLMTTGNKHYRSTGLIGFNEIDKKPQFYHLGDDLEIKVTPSADEAILDLKEKMRQESNKTLIERALYQQALLEETE